ncbi:MAG: non-canonical purine NTP pyrophosphatase [Acidimicrobiales bacterium]
MEDADTLAGNARLKAAAVAAATGEGGGRRHRPRGRRPRGAPGVWSARFAGADATYADNVARLLRELTGLAPAMRTARFRTVAMVRWPNGAEVMAEALSRASSRSSRRAPAGSGTTPCSSPPTETAAPLPRCPRRRSTA